MKHLELKEKLHHFIEIAQEKKLKAIYSLVEDEIKSNYDNWDDAVFIAEISKREQAYLNNASKTYECKGDINLGDLAPDGSQLRPFIVWFEEAVPMMNEAVRITEEADIFVVIGTSLQVYPAAGLLNYVNPYAAKYIIDKNIASSENLGKIVAIEATASEGVLVLQQLLNG